MSDRFQDFIDALYKAGWKSPCDAQHTKVVSVFSEFCDQGLRIEKLSADLTASRQDANDLRHLVRQLDAAIRRIATELTGKACGGVDTGDEINPETGEPYGHGGHTGWLLAEEAKKLKRIKEAANLLRHYWLLTKKSHIEHPQTDEWEKAWEKLDAACCTTK